ncbi:methylmalonyl-CoA epimerase [Planifilum fulgidum]|mgnify:FL=1|jgi:methylmalonyl-CoA/ethylmalonyl-CoA epimerase|uniref:Methylmalonyl-CoA epimerase n=1 Tax=Planifilum fulgidum TaxID=201973 RepID=A0A1I2L5M1_9BACL|nr:methylmalonyl-CoA epimerase [Planifilum fulgidum]SFF74203.1 methylmalonyl-CoA epimerase [Planifilum fulgidum]
MSRTVDPKKISHIGIAVRDLEAALPLYTDVLGLALEGVETVPSEGVKVAFLRIGETRIELLEPLGPDSPIASFLEKRGEGIHHIALEVDGIEERLRLLSEKGIRLIHERPKQGAHGARIAFLHPKATGGVLYELCEPDKTES